MDCLNCGNCKLNTRTYYCLAKGDFIINENFQPDMKVRTGWKKGNKDYESYRRKSKKEVEA
jgi:hypothetical protein